MAKPFNFDDTVFCYYMANGKPCTASEIAEHAGVSASTVRKTIRADRYMCTDTTVTRVTSAHVPRRIDAYEPSLAMMREKLIKRNE